VSEYCNQPVDHPPPCVVTQQKTWLLSNVSHLYSHGLISPPSRLLPTCRPIPGSRLSTTFRLLASCRHALSLIILPKCSRFTCQLLLTALLPGPTPLPALPFFFPCAHPTSQLFPPRPAFPAVSTKTSYIPPEFPNPPFPFSPKIFSPRVRAPTSSAPQCTRHIAPCSHRSRPTSPSPTPPPHAPLLRPHPSTRVHLHAAIPPGIMRLLRVHVDLSYTHVFVPVQEHMIHTRTHTHHFRMCFLRFLHTRTHTHKHTRPPPTPTPIHACAPACCNPSGNYATSASTRRSFIHTCIRASTRTHDTHTYTHTPLPHVFSSLSAHTHTHTQTYTHTHARARM
jgi:hypothetical protein